MVLVAQLEFAAKPLQLFKVNPAEDVKIGPTRYAVKFARIGAGLRKNSLPSLPIGIMPEGAFDPPMVNGAFGECFEGAHGPFLANIAIAVHEEGMPAR